VGLIEDGLSMLNEHLADEGVTVTYERGDGYSVEDLNVVPTKPPFVAPSGTAPMDPTKAERNFSVLASDLLYNLETFFPETTDCIIQRVDNVFHKYAVTKPASGVGCWEWETGYMHGSPLARILIHTKYAGTV
jgi:hypothetical protein